MTGQGEGAPGVLCQREGPGERASAEKGREQQARGGPHPWPSHWVHAERPQRAGPHLPWQGEHWGCPGSRHTPRTPEPPVRREPLGRRL